MLPQQKSRDVIRRIAGAPLVLAESMHAAIIADAFGTPWHAIFISPLINRWKRMDWADSIGIVPVFHHAGAEGPGSQGNSSARVAAAPPPAVGVDRGRIARLKRRIQRPALERRATALLARLAREDGQLSDRARLEEAKDRLRTRLRI